MSEDEKTGLYALSQAERNVVVLDWAARAGWSTEEVSSADGMTYTAFWDPNSDL